MKYLYRIKEVRWTPDHPLYYIERMEYDLVLILLGLAIWESMNESPLTVLEAAKIQVRAYRAADKISRKTIKTTKTKTHYWI